MGGVRIRWKAFGKGALLVGAGLVALQVAPSLLKPPPPPPLAADVGLPQVEIRPEAEPAPISSRPPVAHPGSKIASRRRGPEGQRSGMLSVKIGSKPKPRSHKKRGRPKRATAPPAPAPPPVPAPEPSQPPPPESAPAPREPPTPGPSPAANDGSEEFAPH